VHRAAKPECTPENPVCTAVELVCTPGNPICIAVKPECLPEYLIYTVASLGMVCKLVSWGKAYDWVERCPEHSLGVIFVHHTMVCHKYPGQRMLCLPDLVLQSPFYRMLP
jgi:hypothetical protein